MAVSNRRSGNTASRQNPGRMPQRSKEDKRESRRVIREEEQSSKMVMVAAVIVGGALAILLLIIGIKEYQKPPVETTSADENALSDNTTKKPVPRARPVPQNNGSDGDEAAVTDGETNTTENPKNTTKPADRGNPRNVMARFPPGMELVSMDQQKIIIPLVNEVAREDFRPQEFNAARDKLRELGYKAVPFLMDRFRQLDMSIDSQKSIGQQLYQVLCRITGEGGNPSSDKFFNPMQQNEVQLKSKIRTWLLWWEENFEMHKAAVEAP